MVFFSYNINVVRNMYKSLHIHKGEAEELLISIKEKFPNCKKVQHIVGIINI